LGIGGRVQLEFINEIERSFYDLLHLSLAGVKIRLRNQSRFMDGINALLNLGQSNFFVDVILV
jgi:hypothetical protein